MSLITRCPACETLFKVVPDQLRISEGWVRCGQCDEVFDASVHLVKEFAPGVAITSVTPEPTSVPVLAPAPLDAKTQDATPTVTSQFMDLDLDFTEIEKVESPRIALDFGPAPVNPGAQDLSESLSAAQPSPLPVDVRLPVDPNEIEAPVVPVSEPASTNPEPVSFLQAKSTPSVGQRSLVRAGMGVVTVVLLLTLAGQLVLHERHRLAAYQPQWLPWLTAVCAPLSCSLSPVQQIESVVIESSSFARVQEETYRLSFTLKNTADIRLAMPAIELTLTDNLEQSLVRRVLLAYELNALSESLEPGLAKPVTATFLVKLDATSPLMAGYRLLAFYP